MGPPAAGGTDFQEDQGFEAEESDALRTVPADRSDIETGIEWFSAGTPSGGSVEGEANPEETRASGRGKVEPGLAQHLVSSGGGREDDHTEPSGMGSGVSGWSWRADQPQGSNGPRERRGRLEGERSEG